MIQFLAIARLQATSNTIKADAGLAAFSAHRLVHRATVNQAFNTVCAGQGNQGKPAANFLLVLWMNVLNIGNIRCQRHAHAGNLRSCQLSFPKERQTSAVVTVRSNLNKIERHRLVVPQLAPAVDESLHFFSIQHAFTIVRFTLIPERSANTVRNKRSNHGVIKGQWRLVINVPLGILTWERSEVISNIFQRWHAFETLGSGPRFDPGTAPVRADQTNRHISQSLVLAKVDGEVVAHRGEITNSLRRSNLPT